jgi:hypothetical protein
VLGLLVEHEEHIVLALALLVHTLLIVVDDVLVDEHNFIY